MGIQTLVYRLRMTAKDLWFVKNLYRGKDNKSETLLCGTVLVFVGDTPPRHYMFSEELCKLSCCLTAI